jgi:ATP-dependent exoDNAse (exonuclease V) alpha subunit
MDIMKTEPLPSDREVLAGLVERVTYQNPENGFCVIRVKARGHRDLVTVVGHAAVISAGEWVTASGDWTNDSTHGQQFKARFLKTSAPTSVEGIEKYLASGMIRGIGPFYAKKLLRTFGEKVFDIIEAEPDRLREVDGIGPVRANRIATAASALACSVLLWTCAFNSLISSMTDFCIFHPYYDMGASAGPAAGSRRASPRESSQDRRAPCRQASGCRA